MKEREKEKTLRADFIQGKGCVFHAHFYFGTRFSNEPRKALLINCTENNIGDLWQSLFAR